MPRSTPVLRLLDHTLHELDASFHGSSQTVQLPPPEPEEDIALPPLLEEVLLSLRGLVVQQAAQVEVEVAPTLRLRGRRAGLLAICYNLLSNALQFARPGWWCAAIAWPTGRRCCKCRTTAGAWTRPGQRTPYSTSSGGHR